MRLITRSIDKPQTEFDCSRYTGFTGAGTARLFLFSNHDNCLTFNPQQTPLALNAIVFKRLDAENDHSKIRCKLTTIERNDGQKY